jgi:hypothetical protein
VSAPNRPGSDGFRSDGVGIIQMWNKIGSESGRFGIRTVQYQCCCNEVME